MQYVNDAHLGMRLASSVIRYNGQLFYVRDVQNGFAIGKLYPSGQLVNIPYWECDLKPFPLGYINSGEQCLYATRWPTRIGYKQGLTDNNFCTTPFQVRVVDIIYELVDTAFGIYPSLEEVYAQGYPQAFSRYFAVNPYWNVLYYKGEEVGIIKPNRKYSLNDMAICLTELLEETLDEC